MSKLKITRPRGPDHGHPQDLRGLGEEMLAHNLVPLPTLILEAGESDTPKLIEYATFKFNNLNIEKLNATKTTITSSLKTENFKEDLITLFALILGMNETFPTYDFVAKLIVLDRLKKTMTSVESKAFENLRWDTFITLCERSQIYLKQAGFELPNLELELCLDRPRMLIISNSEREKIIQMNSNSNSNSNSNLKAG